MRNSIARPALVAALLVSLGACQRAQKTAAAPAAPRVEQPALWSIEIMSGDKATNRVDICTDAAVRHSFVRPSPEVDGLPCIATKPAQEDADSYAARCRADGYLYTVNSGTKGDLARDFTVDMNVTRQGSKQPTYEQVRRYRKIGACPAGWRIGDSAGPGDRELLDTISGKRRPMPASGG